MLGAPGGPRRVGVVGLGAGTLAAYGRRGDDYRFFELDPAVERLARGWFTFLADSPARITVVIGDGRRSLAADPTRFDVLVLDAFSSDAVPAHLLTAEAFALYAERLTPGGMVRAATARLDWEMLTIESDPDEDERVWVESARWLLAGPDRRRFLDPRLRAAASPPSFPPRAVLWTDDRADLLGVVK